MERVQYARYIPSPNPLELNSYDLINSIQRYIYNIYIVQFIIINKMGYHNDYNIDE